MSTHTLSSAGLQLATPLASQSVALSPAFQVQGLHLNYGRQAVLDGIDWQLMPGQVVGLLGRNGAGKTTLLESLLGLRDPQRGTAQVFGCDVRALDDATRARIGYVPQQSDLFEQFTTTQLLAYFRTFYPRWNDALVEGLMSRWELPRDKPIAKLSGGQQQRLSIVRALAHGPDLLVLDEPVAALDPLGRRDFLRELVELVLDRGTTVVFSTHILSDLERVAFNVAFMARGQLALQAPLDGLMDQCRLAQGQPMELAPLEQRGATVLSRRALGDGQERWLLQWPEGQVLPDAAAGLQRVQLEDLFEELTA
ncbi:ABC transporter ATP-binding protein [Pelomonas sp. APW6]|uniref:ABC transporter ATP-binding protein n=1 Tax=Roseateles subflavus TaxID=3053353 RepID=A0ABT7LD97_9BURK|nr:ABC transporter ATP-binding protein [Pelomonas sp. APW6]MDL5030823.1 ABC transporter ATP-binding protein [Pelomonas sp. APW6]